MAERKKKPRKTASGKKSQEGPQSSGAGQLWSYALFAIGVSLIGVASATFVLWWQVVVSDNGTHEARTAQHHLDAYAAFFNGRVQGLKKQIDTIATAPTTIAALGSFDPDTIHAASETLSASIPYLRRIDIIEKGSAAVDLNADVPISFAALDVIRRAETQEFVGPEASLHDRGVYYVAKPITIDGRVGGVLFVAISSDYFYDPLKHFDPDAGTLLLTQEFEGTSATSVLEYGRGSDEFETGIRRKLDTAHWSLIFKPSDTMTSALSSVVDLATPAALAIGFLLGGITLSFSRLFAKLDADGATLTDYITRIGRGRVDNLDRFELQLFQHIAAAAGKIQDHIVTVGGLIRRTKEEQKKPGDCADDDYDFDFEAEQSHGVEGEDGETAPNENAPDQSGKGKAATDAEGASDFLDVGPPQIEVDEQLAPVQPDPTIFRAYDIRGIVDESLTEEVVYWIARAFAAESIEARQKRVVVGGDGRHSSESLRDAVARGLCDGGCEVIDIGCVPTPLLYYATHALNTTTGIMVTGSHNPPEYNGLKLVIDGTTLADDAIQKLRSRIEMNELPEGTGQRETMDMAEHYIERIVGDVAIARPLKVVVDCGNGVAGLIAPRLLVEMGCDVVPLYADVDGDFPNHHPDPADPANLEDLITVVQAEQADIGIAFDGDADRLGVVTNAGNIIWPDKLMMLFSRDIVGRNPGADIVYDVKCSRHLNTIISELGGRPIMWKTGHSHIKAKLKETKALLGGEFSGHIFFAERWFGFDDAIYSAARLLEIVGAESNTVEELFAEFPVTCATPEIKIATTDELKFELVDQLVASANFGEGTLTVIDGIRVDYPDGWGLVRASNTSPVLSLRFGADDQPALDRIQQVFRDQLGFIDASLSFP
ncbi:MAG: phosphomannomutase/phosphoglucomutase [Gammaproteobacteria bacterium]|nr:phosphomannomutase/phosphoglucomutase [Gammaproteobacteria bacterium]